MNRSSVEGMETVVPLAKGEVVDGESERALAVAPPLVRPVVRHQCPFVSNGGDEATSASPGW